MLTGPIADDDLLGDTLVTSGEVVSTDEAESILRLHYGVRGTAERLSGEKDCNFQIATENGTCLLLKVVHGSEDRAITNLQTSALLHVADRDPTIPVQRVIRSIRGEAEVEAEVGGTRRMIRIVSFLPGTLQRHAEPSRAQRENVGGALARLQLALADFRHPAENHKLAWDLKHVSDLRPLTAAVDRLDDRRVLDAVLDRFDAEIAPRLVALRTQAVHNDLNGDNVVVDPSDPKVVTGILDFGDLVRTPVVIDVAVAAAYQLQPDNDFLDGALDLIRGFCRVRPLQSAEVDVLFDLIMARMVLRIAITEWRAARFPDNGAYILRNTPLSWVQLRWLDRIPRQRAIDEIGLACKVRSR